MPGKYRKAVVFNFNYSVLDEHIFPYSLLHVEYMRSWTDNVLNLMTQSYCNMIYATYIKYMYSEKEAALGLP